MRKDIRNQKTQETLITPARELTKGLKWHFDVSESTEIQNTVMAVPTSYRFNQKKLVKGVIGRPQTS